MKKHLLLLTLLLKVTPILAQSPFVIDGKTNYITNGKAVLERTAPNWFYSINFKNDTVPVHNHSFVFNGTLKYPAFFRLYLFDKTGKGTRTEHFVVDSGYQKLTSDSTTVPQDNSYYASGQGVLIEGSKPNDEFINIFLPLFKHVNDEINVYLSKNANNFNINDKQAKTDSMAKIEAIRESAINTGDSILNEYASIYPKSSIIPWLLYDAAFRHRYSDYYYKAFEKITLDEPSNINAGLKAFLDIQKRKGIGQVFPLLDFIRSNTADNGVKAKYTLVDFWFSNCGPCINKFNLLKETYKKFHDKGFNIVAISSDKEASLPNYARVIKKFQYPWEQVLDLNGVRTQSINIHIFPTAFLLDSQGKIIQDFINPVLLDAFLEKNL